MSDSSLLELSRWQFTITAILNAMCELDADRRARERPADTRNIS